MAVTLTVNGVAYSFPNTGDQQWGDNVTNWATAVTNGMLQKAGGSFTLTSDVNFGVTFGLISGYYKSGSSNIAASGVFRFAVGDTLNFRNNANSADLPLGVNASDQLTFNSSSFVTTTGTIAASKAVVTDGSGNFITHASTTATQVGYLAAAGSNVHGDTDSATLTNKTLTSPTINTPTLNGSGGTLTLPAGPDTLVGRATTDTLTNKTIAAGSNTLSGLSGTQFSTQTKNTVLAGPTSGSAATPSFRALSPVDLPDPQRNFLLNSDGGLWQRGTSTTISNSAGAYQADRFYAWNSLGSAGVLTYAQAAASNAQSLFGFDVHVSTAPTTAVAFGINWGQSLDNASSMRLYNQTASLSMQIKAKGNVTQVKMAIGYVTSEAKFGITTGLPTTIITSQTVTVNSSTFTLGQLANVSMGTSVTTSGTYFIVCYATAVSSGHVSDLNNGFIIEQPMLNLGATCAAFAAAGENAGAELAMCQRFYEVGGTGTLARASGSTQGEGWGWQFKVTKRVAPTITLNTTTPSIGELSIAGRTGSSSALSVIQSATVTGFADGVITGFSSMTSGNLLVMYGDYLSADAEI